MHATDTVYRAIAGMQDRFPSRTGRIYRQLEKHRAARDDGEATARTLVAASRAGTPVPAAALPEWGGPVTDYRLQRERVDALAVTSALGARVAQAWAEATAVLAPNVSPLPALDVDDLASVARWRTAAEQVLFDALVSVPAPVDPWDSHVLEALDAVGVVPVPSAPRVRIMAAPRG